jgi:hypothetical protein
VPFSEQQVDIQQRNKQQRKDPSPASKFAGFGRTLSVKRDIDSIETPPWIKTLLNIHNIVDLWPSLPSISILHPHLLARTANRRKARRAKQSHRCAPRNVA